VFQHGPSWLGLYEGQSEADICSSLTKVDASLWTQATAACHDLIERKVRATVIGLMSLSALGALWTCTHAAIHHGCYVLCRRTKQCDQRKNEEPDASRVNKMD